MLTMSLAPGFGACGGTKAMKKATHCDDRSVFLLSEVHNNNAKAKGLVFMPCHLPLSTDNSRGSGQCNALSINM